MTDSEKLDLLIVQMQAMNGQIGNLEKQMGSMEMRMDGLEKRMDSIEIRMDGMELQIRSTERNLKNQIMRSESLILDEVERVHVILDDHIHDTKRHTA